MNSSTALRIVQILILVTLVIPIAFVSLSSTDPSGITLYISALLGYAGLGLLIWMFIIGSRSVSHFISRDQIAINKLHQFLGKYGVLLIFLHPLFVVLSYGESAFYSLVPDVSTEFQQHVTMGRIALYILLVIWFSSAILRDKISYRPWRYLHYIAYASLPFALLHAPGVGSTYISSSIAKIYVYTIVVVLVGVLLLRVREWFNLNSYRYTLVSRKEITPRTHLLHMKPANEKLNPKKGQFVYLRQTFFGEQHPFSVLHHDDNGDLYVAFRQFVKYTDKLSRVRPGASLNITGPYGVFTKEIEDVSNIVFIAGGIGITPFLHHILSAGKNDKPLLFFSNPAPSSAPFLDKLRKALGDRIIELYRDKPPRSRGEVGFISEDTIKKYVKKPDEHTYFLCGPPNMIDAAREALVNMHVDVDKIHTEEFRL